LNALVAGVVAGSSQEPVDPALPIWPVAVKVAPVWNLLNTPYSGQLLGLLGPLLSPLVQVVKSFTAVGAYFGAGDVAGAINELINIPTNTTNAFLNGAGYLDLTAIAAKILPDGFEVKSFGVNLGGLLNAVPTNGSFVNPDNPPTEWSGGVGFDGIATDLGLVKFQGLPNGLAGSVVGLGQFLGKELLVTPPAPGQAVAPTAAAAVAPKAAAAVEAPAIPAEPAAPAAPAEPATPAIPAVVEAPAAPEAPAVSEAPTHRGGGGNDKSDNGTHAKGHRGAA
jgi:hypothetical protein